MKMLQETNKTSIKLYLELFKSSETECIIEKFINKISNLLESQNIKAKILNIFPNKPSNELYLDKIIALNANSYFIYCTTQEYIEEQNFLSEQHHLLKCNVKESFDLFVLKTANMIASTIINIESTSFFVYFLHSKKIELNLIPNNFLTVVKDSLAEEKQHEKKIKVENSEYHRMFAENKSQLFIGRENDLKALRNKIMESINDNANINKPLIIRGISGCGKTSIMAYMSTQIAKWIGHPKVKCVLRFIGITEGSYYSRDLLLSIIIELSKEFSIPYDEENISSDRINDYFRAYLNEVAMKNPNIFFVIMLDSLDQLSQRKDAKELSWFPVHVRGNMKIIASALKDTVADLLKNMEKDPFFIYDLENFGLSDLEKYLDTKLKNFTDESHITEIKNKLTQDNDNKTKYSPLYLKLTVDQIILSINNGNIDLTPLDETKNEEAIAKTNEEAIVKYLEKIENNFKDHDLVQEILAYITLSRYGFQDIYLIELIKKEKKDLEFEVINLLFMLREYMFGPSFQWFHRAFKETAEMRYCDISKKPKFNRKLVDTFLPDINKDEFLIKELPYHAVGSPEKDILKTHFLANFNFIQIKIHRIGIDDLINDYNIALESFENDVLLKTLYKTFLLAALKLRNEPFQLLGQLYGRLYLEDSSKDVEDFILECKKPFCTSIIPTSAFMAGPSEYLSQDSFIAHIAETTDMILTNNKEYILTSCSDKTINIYFSTSCRIKSTITRKCTQNKNLLMSDDDTIVYAWCKKDDINIIEDVIIEAFDFQKSNQLFEIKRSKLVDRCKERLLFFNTTLDKLWLITKDNMYFFDWKSETFDKFIKLDQLFSGMNDKRLSYDKRFGYVVVGMENKSNLIRLNEDGTQHAFKIGSYELRSGRVRIGDEKHVIISCRQIFKSKFGGEYTKWHILIYNFELDKIINEIPINSAIHTWHQSTDSSIYVFVYNYIYVLDLKKSIVSYALRNSLQFNAGCALNDYKILTVTYDNKILIWNLPQISESQVNTREPNVFNSLCSRMTQLLTDDFDTFSRYILVYDIFESYKTEMLLIYDLEKKKISKRFMLTDFDLNDLQPLCFLSNKYCVFFRNSTNSFYFIDINDFKVIKTFNSSKEKFYQRISKNQIVISVVNKFCLINLVLFNMDTCEEKILIKNWQILPKYYTKNYKNIIYKKIDDNKNFWNLYQFGDDEPILFQTENLDINEKKYTFEKIFSSEQGNMLGLLYKTEDKLNHLFIYEIHHDNNNDRVTKIHELKEQPEVFIAQFIGEIHLLYQFVTRDSRRITMVYDLKKNESPYEWFNDDNHDGSAFCCLKHEKSKYVWYYRYQVFKSRQIAADLTVFNSENMNHRIATLDVDLRLKVGVGYLLDNGDAFLGEIFDKLEFVDFRLVSKDNVNQNKIYSEYKLDNEELIDFKVQKSDLI